MIIYASGTQCDFLRAESIFSQFANIKRLHFTGLQCPFRELSSVNQVQLHFIRSQERIIKDVDFSTRKPQLIHLSDLAKLEVVDICCGLLTGYAEAPLLQNLTILCPELQLEIDGTPDAIPILDDKTGFLHIQAPLLRRVEIQESSVSFFPTASVSNLPALHSLFIKSCEFCRQTPKSIPHASNLPALSALVSYRESPSLLPMSLRLKTVCVQMGSSQLHFVRLLNPPAAGMRCASLWHCDACGLSESEADIIYKGIVSTNRSNSLTFLAPFQLGNDDELYQNPVLTGSRRQTVEIFLRSPSETPLSTILPAVAALNTTDLELSHSPVLILEGKYRTFKWLDERAEKLRAGLRCHRVLDLKRTDLGTVENRWMSQITDFTCRTSASAAVSLVAGEDSQP
ncbi:unnamed protein product [Dibothriocephalus latus]|uniref:Uncharacterized protein n=1 Tax=Dibothriocephalus latus TaxID=60516 RepID=A0A3P6TN57_DIBLA|nr:unnamed protein product [Dibothriocephalus latus]